MANTSPALILLLRHGEKTGDQSDHDLSAEGHVRAEHLARYIPDMYGKPDAIFAARKSKHSNRSVQTVEPLATATGVSLDKTYEDDDYGALAGRLMSDPALSGKTVVVCWHHSDLPKIARALGAPPGSFPDPWDPQVFNLIIEVRHAANATVTVLQSIQPF